MGQIRHTGNIQPQLDLEEHDHLEGGVAVRKVGNYVWNGSDWERWDGTVDIDMATEGIATEDKQDDQIELITSKISTVNSTNQQLGINETFTGEWEDVTNYAEVIVTIYTTHTSVTDGLKVEWSMDGINVHGDDVFTISANSGKTFTFPCQTKYFRVRYTNDGVATTTFSLSSALKVRASKGSSHRLKDALVKEDDAIVTKTLIAGFSTSQGGQIHDVKVNPSGALNVAGTFAATEEIPTEVDYTWDAGNLTQKIEYMPTRTITTDYQWSNGNLVNKTITIT